jgi:hypothetical protein
MLGRQAVNRQANIDSEAATACNQFHALANAAAVEGLMPIARIPLKERGGYLYAATSQHHCTTSLTDDVMHAGCNHTYAQGHLDTDLSVSLSRASASGTSRQQQTLIAAESSDEVSNYRGLLVTTNDIVTASPSTQNQSPASPWVSHSRQHSPS